MSKKQSESRVEAPSASTTRRTFIKTGIGALAATQAGLLACAPDGGGPATTPKPTPPRDRTPPAPRVDVDPPPTDPKQGQKDAPPVSGAKVFLVETKSREEGIPQLLSMAGGLSFAANRKVLIKPNLVSTNPFPATTHDDALRVMVRELKKAGAQEILLGESSGLGRTRQVISSLGTEALCKELGIQWMNFDDLPQDQWENFSFPDMNWQGELAIPKVLRDEDIAVVWMPNCKTHGMGGHFTMSLKLAVGVTPVDRRGHLHSAGNIPEWSADINAGFQPDLVLMDAISCFIDGGPTSGTVRHPGLMLAGTDRVAIDAVGLAILKAHGSNTSYTRNKIFEQPMLKRAIQLKLGVSSPDQIELVGEGKSTQKLREILDLG